MLTSNLTLDYNVFKFKLMLVNKSNVSFYIKVRPAASGQNEDHAFFSLIEPESRSGRSNYFVRDNSNMTVNVSIYDGIQAADDVFLHIYAVQTNITNSHIVTEMQSLKDGPEDALVATLNILRQPQQDAFSRGRLFSPGKEWGRNRQEGQSAEGRVGNKFTLSTAAAVASLVKQLLC
ncbi:hypothetical protein Ddc_12410 [Ditylenchus destructor]|nr:hypothetical protein Ddc_12410 [Ditylenchus destructor]